LEKTKSENLNMLVRIQHSPLLE